MLLFYDSTLPATFTNLAARIGHGKSTFPGLKDGKMPLTLLTKAKMAIVNNSASRQLGQWPDFSEMMQ